MHLLRTVLLGALLILTAFLFHQIQERDRSYRELKHDLVTVSDIRYGLFNIDSWKAIVGDILSAKVADLDLSDEDRGALKVKIERFLTNAIEEFEDRYYEEKSKSWRGMLESGVASFTGTFKQIKKDIPVFTEQILLFIDAEENREAIKAYIMEQVNQYADNTFASVDYTPVNEIITRHGQADAKATQSYLIAELDQLASEQPWIHLTAGGLVLLVCLILLFGPTLQGIQVYLTVGISLILLYAGISLPMIEIDARVSELQFHLMGEEVRFADQVLFYKSKSILEVIALMFEQGQIEVLLVGGLILAFSVLFPLCKLLATVYDTAMRPRRSGLLKFLLFKSGKWSMADVFVVAIFMAYIGFEGILSEQLGQLSRPSNDLKVITTSASTLLLGFYAFLSYVLVSLCMSQRIHEHPSA